MLIEETNKYYQKEKEIYEATTKGEKKTITKVKNAPVVLYETYNFLIIFKPRVPNQRTITKHPENHYWIVALSNQNYYLIITNRQRKFSDLESHKQKLKKKNQNNATRTRPKSKTKISKYQHNKSKPRISKCNRKMQHKKKEKKIIEQ